MSGPECEQPDCENYPMVVTPAGVLCRDCADDLAAQERDQ